jgi:hypothetical protein
MTAVCVSGYGEGYSEGHPFKRLCNSLKADQPSLKEYSLPNAGAPRLRECTDFFGSLLRSGGITELYLHSLAVNVFRHAAQNLPPECVADLQRTLKAIFLVAPGVGQMVAEDYFPELAEFYSGQRNADSDWRGVLNLSHHKPCMVVSPDDPYLESHEVYEMKSIDGADGESAFHWINAPLGTHHFCQHSDLALVATVIESIREIRKVLLGSNLGGDRGSN